MRNNGGHKKEELYIRSTERKKKVEILLYSLVELSFLKKAK